LNISSPNQKQKLKGRKDDMRGSIVSKQKFEKGNARCLLIKKRLGKRTRVHGGLFRPWGGNWLV